MLPACLSCTRTHPVRPSLQTTLTPADFAAAQVDFVPHSLRDVKLQKSEVAWHDIGGASSLLTTLMSARWRYHFGHCQLTCASCACFQVYGRRNESCARRSSGRPSTVPYSRSRLYGSAPGMLLYSLCPAHSNPDGKWAVYCYTDTLVAGRRSLRRQWRRNAGSTSSASRAQNC